MDLLGFTLGIVIGFVLGYLVLKYTSKRKHEKEIKEFELKLNEADKSTSIADEKIHLINKDKEKIETALNETREKNTQLTAGYSRLKANNENLEKRLEEQKAELEKLNERFAKEFENLANRIFEAKGQKFTEQNKELVQNLLNPLGEKIGDFQKRINDIYQEDTKERTALKEQIRNLSELNKQMSQDAENLTKALKGDTKTQGAWGEFILESILEKSGLAKGEQYEIQTSFTSEDGKRQRPDVIIRLPENKNIIIDSKVSLTAYERFTSSDRENEKANALKEHISSIRTHVKMLSGKNYQNLYELKSLDFVLMFVPIEPAFGLAVQNEPSIFNEAFEKNIVIVSPTTLLATLRTINNIWQQERQNKYALEIAKQSGALYDKFVGFVDDLIDIGKKIDSTKDSYSNAMKKLYDGSGNLVRRAEKIKELGAKATKSLPQNLLEKSEE
ncbi:MAG: DNA recombination protein RmuC [Ignavibacteria bacterium]|jgi:DNA recombination protein RmuC